MPRFDVASGADFPPVSDPIAAQAIAWAVRLRSGDAAEAERSAFSAWRRADPRHEAAAARLEQALGVFGTLPTAPTPRLGVRRTLLALPERRRLLRNTLALAILGAGSGLLLHRHTPMQTLLAVLSTGTGERRQFPLPDGSRLWLNARSAVDLAFDNEARRLHLRAGELIVEVARDPRRPFIVYSEEGAVQALGTRFLVRQEAGSTLVAVLHSAVRIEPAEGGEGAADTLAEGRSARFDSRRIHPETLPPRAITAWEDGFIEVHDRPLEEVVAALRPYRPGLLRLSPDAARLRVTGSFPLDDSERTLAALAETLPIAIRRRTDYWIAIDLR